MVDLKLGDCLEVMATLPENSVDTIITDPPYGLEFMGKDWDKVVPGVHFWQAALRVAKPGATMLAFGGTRTSHRLAVAIEDAGWELRDTIGWIYGTGFPKSTDISKAIDKAAGVEREYKKGRYSSRRPRANVTANTYGNNGKKNPGTSNSALISTPATPAAAEWQGWGTALKPAWEPIIVAMKPLDGTNANNALKWGVAGLHIDGGRVSTSDDTSRTGINSLIALSRKGFQLGYRPNQYYTEENSTEMMTGGHSAGRWPANLIHDGSDEVLALFPQTTQNGRGPTPANTERTNANAQVYGFATYKDMIKSGAHFGDSGSAARFFYCAKASKAERNAGLEDERNHHPTLKPLALMRYLCALTATPTGGVILDPFMGSGSTGVAAASTGRDFIGIELNPEYLEIARRRIEHATAQMRLL